MRAKKQQDFGLAGRGSPLPAANMQNGAHGVARPAQIKTLPMNLSAGFASGFME